MHGCFASLRITEKVRSKGAELRSACTGGGARTYAICGDTPFPTRNRGDTPSHANRGEPRTRTIREDTLTHIWIRGRLMRAQLKEFHISTMRFCKLLTSC